MTDKSVTKLMDKIGKRAKKAAYKLAIAPTEQKNAALRSAAKAVRKNRAKIREANDKDMSKAEEKGLSPAMKDRLLLSTDRIDAIADGLEAVANLPDPVGAVLDHWERPSGIAIDRVRVPLGVIGVIYESRPNVTADAGALCLKSGNAAILRGGSESFYSSSALMDCLNKGLDKADLPSGCIQMIPTTDRAAVGALLKMSNSVDVIVPRGGKGLIQRVTAESRIPIFKHLDGICHTYIHEEADLDMAVAVTLNAKLRRTGLCNTTETLLIDKSIVKSHLPAIANKLIENGCTLKGDKTARKVDDRLSKAKKEDWATEYLDSILSIKTVDDIDDALSHIAKYSSNHTESIITRNTEAAERFLNEVDSAIVMHNSSTQFSDGGEFGMGAEIGISTGKLHARGPIGVEQLTSFKYKVRSNGAVRR